MTTDEVSDETRSKKAPYVLIVVIIIVFGIVILTLNPDLATALARPS